MADEGSYFQKVRQLERALARCNGGATALGEIAGLLVDPDVLRHFFRTLDRPDWIVPLFDAGYFNQPRPSQPTGDGGRSFPPWAASGYLARMAGLAPSPVASVFEAMRTDNMSVVADMLKAARAMPASVAARLVTRVASAAREGLSWVFLTDAAGLCIHLAQGDEIAPAMVLARSIFQPRVTDGEPAAPHGDDHWYRSELAKVAPVLAAREPEAFLTMLCDWLDQCIAAKAYTDHDTGMDHSHVWRPAIEEHAQNPDHGLEDTLIACMRNGLEEAIHSGHVPLPRALQILEGHRFLIFRRIRLHLICEFAVGCQELATRTIMDRALFDSHECKHEYARLVGQRLDLLTPRDREVWFGWIDAGPPADTDYTEREREGWRFRKLHWVREHLDGARQVFYRRMLANYGEPRLADLNFRTDTRWGQVSPMTVEDLAQLAFRDAVTRVCTWTPGSHGFDEPEIGGLASTFERYVATNPEAFSQEAALLVDRPAIFVRSFLDPISGAVKAGRDIDVGSVLALCEWAVARPVAERTTPGQPEEPLVDKDWQWTRDQIASFVENVCREMVDGRPRLPLQPLRERLWSLLGPMCTGSAASYVPSDRSGDDPRLCDYLDQAINSPRGKAVQAALAYARWVANHVKRTEDGRDIVPGGFDVMPEVREMLEWQVDADNRTVEVLSVLGEHVNLLYWIDKAWLADHAADLFDLDRSPAGELSATGWAAWNALLVWVPPHIEFYKLFRQQFTIAVRESCQVEPKEQTREQPILRLGEHLMILYGRGQLSLDDDDGLLRRFLHETHPDIRRHTIGFVGRSLESDEHVPPAEVIERFVALWDLYWGSVGRQDATDRPDAELFATWFSCGQFPAAWALHRFEEFLEAVPTREPERGMLEQLAKISDAGLDRSARILDRLVRNDREGWRIDARGGEVKAILAKAMAAGGDARAKAERTIDLLGRRGFVEFGELLPAD